MPLEFWIYGIPSIGAGVAFILGARMHPFCLPLWAVLDRLYRASSVVAAGFMVLILLIILAQIISRWLNIAFEGASEYAGYAMAATSFFALAYTLTRGGHIRVSLLLNRNHFSRYWLDALALFMGAIIATHFARFALKTTLVSYQLNDRTQGQDKIPIGFEALLGVESAWVFTPIWIVQLPMAVGTVLLAIALWDHLIRLAVLRRNTITPEVLE